MWIYTYKEYHNLYYDYYELKPNLNKTLVSDTCAHSHKHVVNSDKSNTDKSKSDKSNSNKDASATRVNKLNDKWSNLVWIPKASK